MTDEKNEQGLAGSNTMDPVTEASTILELKNQLDGLIIENKRLTQAKHDYYDAVLNGTHVEESAPKLRSRDEIRNDLFGREDKDNMTNLDYAKLAVELDDACIRENGESCFLPKGKGVTPTVDERDVAVRMNAALKDCIEQANDDPKEFDRAWARYVK